MEIRMELGSSASRPELNDDTVRRDCRWEAFRGPGPGGQKRNKTSSAVRVTHEPSGLSALAGESRSQARNRTKALERLKHRLAVELRRPVDLERFESPPWLTPRAGGNGSAKLCRQGEDHLAALGLVLDVVAAAGGSVSEAARRLGVSTANLVDFLQRDEQALSYVNRLRASAGLRPLGGA
jgi:hypothetical protein